MTGQKLQAQAAGFEESTPDQAVEALLVPEELQGALSVWYDRCTGAVADEGLHCTEGIEFTRAQSELVCPGEFGTPDDVPILNYQRRRRVVCERNERRKLGTSRSIALDREAQCPSILKFFEGCRELASATRMPFETWFNFEQSGVALGCQDAFAPARRRDELFSEPLSQRSQRRPSGRDRHSSSPGSWAAVAARTSKVSWIGLRRNSRDPTTSEESPSPPASCLRKVGSATT